MSAKEKRTGIMAEFQQFIARGNVMDLAVGVIIGGAFKSIVDSLIADIINPILGIFTGGYTALAGLVLALPWGGDILVGNFLNAILNFFIMALVVFLLVKGMNTLHRKKEDTPPPPAPPEPSQEELLLTEIRDLLKEKR